MAAKVATRTKTTKIDEDGERFVVVSRETGRRIYLGDGVDQDSAETLAASLLTPAIAVPIAQIVDSVYVKPEAETAEATDVEETVEEKELAVA